MTTKHKFINRKINPNTKILVIGTFNPDNEANKNCDFFYSRSRNHFWKLLQISFDDKYVKFSCRKEKEEYIKNKNIDFVDIIKEVRGNLKNYTDELLDDKVLNWAGIISLIKNTPTIERVCFTRKTFNGIPYIKKKILEIEKYCKDNNIYFEKLITPARCYNYAKQAVWTKFFKYADSRHI